MFGAHATEYTWSPLSAGKANSATGSHLWWSWSNSQTYKFSNQLYSKLGLWLLTISMGLIRRHLFSKPARLQKFDYNLMSPEHTWVFLSSKIQLNRLGNYKFSGWRRVIKPDNTWQGSTPLVTIPWLPISPMGMLVTIFSFWCVYFVWLEIVNDSRQKE